MLPAPDPLPPWHFETGPRRSHTGHPEIHRDQPQAAYSWCASLNLSFFPADSVSNGSPSSELSAPGLLAETSSPSLCCIASSPCFWTTRHVPFAGCLASLCSYPGHDHVGPELRR